MPTSSTILAAHTVLHLRSFDRLFLNLYVPKLQRPEQVSYFLRTPETPIPSPVLFQRRSDAFVRDLRAYAAAHGAEWLHFTRGERKEERMRPYLRAAERAERSGLVAVGIAQERTFGWGFTKTPSERGTTFGFVRRSVYVNHYYLYLWDADWGPSFIKLCGYAPWGGRVWLNGHEWLKRQLTKAGIAFRPLANGLLACERPAVAQELASRLGASEVRAYLARWQGELPQPLTVADRERGYGYACSMKQIEIDTRVFDRPLRGRNGQATIAERPPSGGRRRSRSSSTAGDRRTRRFGHRPRRRIRRDLFRYKHSTLSGTSGRPRARLNDEHTYDLRAIDTWARSARRAGGVNASWPPGRHRGRPPCRGEPLRSCCPGAPRPAGASRRSASATRASWRSLRRWWRSPTSPRASRTPSSGDPSPRSSAARWRSTRRRA